VGVSLPKKDERWEPDSYFEESNLENDEEKTSNERKKEQQLIDKFVSDCL
jgi:hypothetical protein